MAAPKIAVDIRDWLAGAPLSLSDVTVDGLNPTPINQYAVIEYEGPPPTRVHGSGHGVAFDNANLQILARHAKSETARNRIHAIVDALDGLQDTTINGTVYHAVIGMDRPRLLMREENGSFVYCWHIFVQARR